MQRNGQGIQRMEAYSAGHCRYVSFAPDNTLSDSFLDSMSPDPYKQSLTDAAARLVHIRELLFDATFQVAIANELRDWSDTVEVGEVHTISKELLESCSDPNVQLLTKLLTNVERTCDSLLNLNSLELEEEDPD